MIDIELLWTTQLGPTHHAEMASLFDGEYVQEWGPWNPKGGYGYAGSELHALARMDGRLVGHAASARRFIRVGDGEVVIAGIGGVLTDQQARGLGVGRRVLTALQETMGSFAPADFGLLGCREEVVPFYESCGFTRVDAVVRDISPRDGKTVKDGRGPTMICAGARPVPAWPEGMIDLRGLPW